MSQSLYNIKVKESGGGSEKSLEEYTGQVLLIVNTASRCGFTPQYEGLEALFKAYKDRGFSVLAFPCNQFGAQEPGSDEDVSQFCSLNFGVSFPIFAKIDVNGETADPLFQFLKSEAPGILGSKTIKWNFTKFLVDRKGQVVERFAPTTEPKDISQKIEELLG